MDLGDPPGESPQRVGIGRDGQLVQVLSVIGDEADIELFSTQIEPSVDHVCGPPWCVSVG
jgi:hypothetical protein